MSQENVEIVRKVYDAWTAAITSQAFEYLDPDVVWEAIEDAPDAGTYRKRSGVKRYMEDWLQDFEMLPFEIRRSIDAEDRLVIEQRGTTKGRGSGLTTVINYAAVYTFRDGKVLTVKEYSTFPKPSKQSAWRSKTLAPSPEPCGILRGRCRRRTWRWFGAGFKAWKPSGRCLMSTSSGTSATAKCWTLTACTSGAMPLSRLLDITGARGRTIVSMRRNSGMRDRASWSWCANEAVERAAALRSTSGLHRYGL